MRSNIILQLHLITSSIFFKIRRPKYTCLYNIFAVTVGCALGNSDKNDENTLAVAAAQWEQAVEEKDSVGIARSFAPDAVFHHFL